MSTERTTLGEGLPRVGAPPVALEIDHVDVSVPEGVSVLRAAELAGVPVPSLCSHKELSAFGGCRLCAVEIAGMRGYPLACSTAVKEGMKVTTDTVALREMREEVLQLILSQHPASCLLCDEQEDCRRNQTTIRKAGVSTGCRTCPRDGACELQDLVRQVGLTGLEYPVSYRGLEPEHDDPFYDRDYNLCILCGRCVRMCQEVRGTAVLAFKYRGPRTLIGPAFGNSHAEAGCEFCGACVSVCPTGALADKVSKWDGAAEAVEVSTCPFCGVGCQLEIGRAHGALSWARGAHDEQINDGQLCVRGRFCLPETTHHPDRARKPMLRHGRYFRVAAWNEALDAIAGRLAGAAPRDVLMLVSADLTNEGLYAAQRFAREGLKGAGVDSTARARLPGGPATWSRLFALPVSFHDLGQAEAVVVAGLDSRFAFSVVGVQVRRAVRRGGRLVVVDARESNLVRAADRWLQPPPGEETVALAALLRALGGGEAPREGALVEAASRLREARTLAVVVGPRVFAAPGGEELVAELEALAAREGTTIVPLWEGANVRGALELGGFAGVLPGPRPARRRSLTFDDLAAGRRPSVLYLVGEAPFTTRPDCDYVIAQDLYLPPFPVDAFLPAASFAEAGGTLTNLEGRVQELRAVEERPEGASPARPRPDWRIFSDLALRLGQPGLEYADAAAVRAAIRAELPGFPADGDRSPRRMTALPASRRRRRGVGDAAAPASTCVAGAAAPTRAARFVLVPEPSVFRHRGVDLATVVEGLGELHLEDGVRMSPDDLEALGVAPGSIVTVDADGLQVALPARADAACPRGAVYVTQAQAWGGHGGEAAPPALELLSHLPGRPVKARVRAGDHAKGRVRAGDHAKGRVRAGDQVKARAPSGDRARPAKKGGGRAARR